MRQIKRQIMQFICHFRALHPSCKEGVELEDREF